MFTVKLVTMKQNQASPAKQASGQRIGAYTERGKTRSFMLRISHGQQFVADGISQVVKNQ